MKITPDTNVLVRMVMDDDPVQAEVARKTLEQAATVVLTLTALCEMVWVLAKGYGVKRAGIAGAIRRFMTIDTMEMNRPAVEAGLRLLEAGGDFADGVIAYEGRWLGGEVFCSFDKQAVRLLEKVGVAARLV